VHGTVTIDVEVHPYDEKADISKGRFVEYSENSATVSAVQDNDCTSVLKYGYPPFVKYGYPAGEAPCAPVTEADGSVRYKYGYPSAANAACPPVTEADGSVRYKYGYPSAANAACPPVLDADGSVRY
jgi:hypothetical protein